MRIEELSNEKEWETFVCSSDAATVYHSLKWKEVVERSFPHRALYLVARNAGGKLVAVLPGFIVKSMGITVYDSIPYSDYGGPIVDPSHSLDVSLKILDFLSELSIPQAPTYARLRVTNRSLKRSIGSVVDRTQSAIGVMEIDLARISSKLVWNKLFSSNRRKKFKQMERRGFHVREAQTRSDLQVFYNLYLRNMRHIGVNPFPFGFMENIWDILHPSYVRIWIVEDTRPVAAKLFFRFKNSSFSAYVGIDRDHQSVYPFSRYLTWTEIKRAEEEGLTRISLGQTPNDPDNKYFLQKSSLGCTFYPQTMLWVPLSSYGLVLIRMRSVGLLLWKRARGSLPRLITRILEGRLARL